jgi:hypothetical protein
MHSSSKWGCVSGEKLNYTNSLPTGFGCAVKGRVAIPLTQHTSVGRFLTFMKRLQLKEWFQFPKEMELWVQFSIYIYSGF